MNIQHIEIYKSDSYHTNDNTFRYLLDKLLFNSRFVFAFTFVMELMRSRRIALKGNYDTQNWIKSSLNIFQIIENCGGRFHIQGLDNIRNTTGPVVFISNHMSTLETMVFPGLIAPFKDVTFVVKESLVHHSLFGPIMRARNPIIVSRSNSRADLINVMNKGQEFLSNGTSIVIFPQSSRKVEFNPKEFNSLGVKLAKAAKVPIIPVAIKTDFWQNGKFIRDMGPLDRSKPIHILFDKPIFNVSGKDENQKIIDFISSRLIEWNRNEVKK